MLEFKLLKVGDTGRGEQKSRLVVVEKETDEVVEGLTKKRRGWEGEFRHTVGDTKTVRTVLGGY